MFERGFNVYIMNQKPPFSKQEKRDCHGKRRKREICMAREGKEILALQEMEKRDNHGKRRKRKICMAREGKERFAWQEKDLCPIVGDEPDWERRGRDA